MHLYSLNFCYSVNGQEDLCRKSAEQSSYWAELSDDCHDVVRTHLLMAAIAGDDNRRAQRKTISNQIFINFTSTNRTATFEDSASVNDQLSRAQKLLD